MYTERPADLRNLCLTPAKKNGRAKLEEESQMREGIELMRGAAFPDQEFGGGIGIGVAPPDHLDLEAECPL